MHKRFPKKQKLSRKSGARKQLMRSLASQVILHEKITTTLAKARAVQPIVERLITKAKVDSVHSRRQVARFLSFNDKSLNKLFEELGPLYKKRNGGYTRIVKLGKRPGDNAEMAQIQLLDTEKLTEKTKKETQRSSSGKKTAVKKSDSKENSNKKSKDSSEAKKNKRSDKK